MTATVNGIRLSYSDIGRGIPLVCLHGGMGVNAGCLHVPGILDLAQLGIRLIIPDQRGHGHCDSARGHWRSPFLTCAWRIAKVVIVS
jgi:pimeloyl-ACP methyl ester carboxylesterase